MRRDSTGGASRARCQPNISGIHESDFFLINVGKAQQPAFLRILRRNQTSTGDHTANNKQREAGSDINHGILVRESCGMILWTKSKFSTAGIVAACVAPLRRLIDFYWSFIGSASYQ